MGYFNRLLSSDVDRRALGMGLIAAGGPLLAHRSLDPGNAGKRIAEAGINFAQTYQTAADRNLLLARQAKQLGAAEDFYKLLGQDPNAPYGPVAATAAPTAAPTAVPTAAPAAAPTFASTLGGAGSPLLQMPVEEAPVQEVPMTRDEAQSIFDEAVAPRPPGFRAEAVQEQPVPMPPRPTAALEQPNMVRQRALDAAFFRAFPGEAAGAFGKAWAENRFAPTLEQKDWGSYAGADGRQRYKFGPKAGHLIDPAAVTADQQKIADAGFPPGSPEGYEWLRTQGGGISVNVGPQGVQYQDPPRDFDYIRDETGTIKLFPSEGGGMAPRLQVLHGSETHRDRVEQAKKLAATEKTKVTKSLVMMRTFDDINETMDKYEGSWVPLTGLGGKAVSLVPGTPAHDIGQSLDVIRANIAFGVITKMRQESPTGGAVGQLTDDERKALSDTMGALAQSQSKDAFRKNLKAVERTYLDTVFGQGKWRKGGIAGLELLHKDDDEWHSASQTYGAISMEATADESVISDPPSEDAAAWAKENPGMSKFDNDTGDVWVPVGGVWTKR